MQDPIALAYQQDLTSQQFYVAYNGGSGIPFLEEYSDTVSDGIYVSIASHTPLFSSKDKYNAHTGWPSFTAVLPTAPVEYLDDGVWPFKEIQLRCTIDHVNLGHVFDDGPNGGKRYCMNSHAILFVGKEEMTES